MNTVSTLQINSTSSENTEQIGKKIGANLKGGEVIVLASDLGGGKTTLTRGIVTGTGSNDAVASPTFTVSRVYNAPSFTVHHFDFYRLQDPGIIAHELQEVMQDTKTVVIVEWADIVENVLPADYMKITIEQTGDDTRLLQVTVPDLATYVLKDVE